MFNGHVCFAQEVDWCLKDRDKQRLQTTVSKNLWKIFAGYTGDWLDVRTASICTTDLWDALKSFILNSLKFKVAPLKEVHEKRKLSPGRRREWVGGVGIDTICWHNI